MDKRTRYGKLLVKHIVDENNIHCVCDCGTKIIVTENQLDDNSSCGCVHRILLWAYHGEADKGGAFNENKMPEQHGGRGLNYDKQKKKWRARIIFQSKEYHLGYYQEKESALKIRREAENNIGDNFIKWYANLKTNK